MLQRDMLMFLTEKERANVVSLRKWFEQVRSDIAGRAALELLKKHWSEFGTKKQLAQDLEKKMKNNVNNFKAHLRKDMVKLSNGCISIQKQKKFNQNPRDKCT